MAIAQLLGCPDNSFCYVLGSQSLGLDGDGCHYEQSRFVMDHCRFEAAAGLLGHLGPGSDLEVIVSGFWVF